MNEICVNVDLVNEVVAISANLSRVSAIQHLRHSLASVMYIGVRDSKRVLDLILIRDPDHVPFKAANGNYYIRYNLTGK